MAEQKDIHCTVITPERRVLDETAEAVVIPAHDGELGVLRNRAALMCELGVGQFRYSKGGRTHRVFIDGGFAQVHNNEVTVLTNQAIPAGQVTSEVTAEVEQELARLSGTDAATQDARWHAARKLSVLCSLQGSD